MRNTKRRHRIVRPLSCCEPLEKRQLMSITVNADNTLWSTATNIAGTNILSHTTPNNFVNGTANGQTLPFQADASAAGVKLIRTNAFPDDRNLTSPSNTLAFFDQKVTAIQSVGATPLLIQYVSPNLSYYNVDGTLGTGGNYATNLVWLVKHYLGQDGSGFNIQKQYYEIGNEPDLTEDYPVSNWIEYAQIFQECNDALVAAGLRSHVVLNMGVISHSYDDPVITNNVGTLALKYTLAVASPGSIDNIDYHEYGSGSSADNVLNSVNLLDNLESVDRNVFFGHSTVDNNQDMGAASLAGFKAELGLQNVGLGVTEYNLSPGSFSASHTITQGLWDLALTSEMLKDPNSQLANSFVFDDQGSGGYGIYNGSSPPQLDYSYWALYIRGKLTGSSVLDETTTGNANAAGNPYLLTTATRDANYVYLEVINRNTTTAIADTLTLNGVTISGNATIYKMSDNGGVSVTPNTSTSAAFTSGESYTFAQQSATIFKIPYTAAAGFGLSVDQQYQSVTRGSSKTYVVTFKPQNGFTGTPTLNVPNLPTGITAAITSLGSNKYNVVLTTTTGMTQGAYALNVSATASGVTANVPIWLVATTPDFGVYSTPASYTPTTQASVAAGNKTTADVSIVPAGGFAGTANITVSGLPTGVTVSGTMSITKAGYVPLTISTTSATPVGLYTITFTATSGTLTHSSTTKLNVIAAAAAPAAPTGLAATAYNGNLVTLAWTNHATDATNIAIERSTDGVNYTELIDFNSGAVTSYADVQASPSTQYYYRVRSLNLKGVSSYSNIATATTPTPEGTAIGFETADGYSAGQLVGQPSTAGVPKWTGAATLFKVVAGAGNPGQAIVSAPATISPAVAAFSDENYIPDSTDFQGDSAPVTAGYTGKIDYSFDVEMNSTPNNTSSSQAWFIRMGTGAAEFFVMANGTVMIRSSAGDFNATTTSGGTTNFDFDNYGVNKYVTIHGDIDYSAKTFTCYVNGVEQELSGSFNLPVQNATNATSFSLIRAQNNLATNATGYQQISLDNISFFAASGAGADIAMKAAVVKPLAAVRNPSTTSTASTGGLFADSLIDSESTPVTYDDLEKWLIKKSAASVKLFDYIHRARYVAHKRLRIEV